MALLMLEGWQVNHDEQAVKNSAEYISALNSFAMVDGEARTFRGRSLRCDRQDGANNPKLTLPISPNISTVIVGMAVKWQGDCRDYQGAGIPFIEFKNGATRQSHFEWAATSNEDEFIGAFVDNNGTKHFFNGNFPVNVWHQLEMKITFAGSGGTWEVRMNESVVESGAGNTGPAGSINSIPFNFIMGGSGPANHGFVTDIYVCDSSGSYNNDFLGTVGVEPKILSGDEGTNEFGVYPSSSPANYTAVDDNITNPDSDSTYVFTQSNGNIDLYNTADMQTLQSTVNGFKWGATARFSGASGTRTIRSRYKVGGVGAGGDSFTISSTSYRTFSDLREADPTTGSQWTLGNINNLAIGVESVA